MVGEPKIGKTTLMNYIYRNIEKNFKCVCFRYIPRFTQFATEVFKNLNDKKEDWKDLRDAGNAIINVSEEYKSEVIIMLDNFEEF